MLASQNGGQRQVKWLRVSLTLDRMGSLGRLLASPGEDKFALPDIVFTQTRYSSSLQRDTTRAIVAPSTLWSS